MEGTGRWESHVWRHGKSPMSSGRGLSRCCRQHREGTRSSNTRGRRERVASARIRVWYSRRSCTFCARAANGRHCRRSVSVVPARSTNAFSNGQRLGGSCDSGRRGWPSMTRWRASLGDGKASTGPWSRHRLLKNLSGPTRRIGGKNGSKRMLLVDERGAPLSIIVTGANRHDVTQLATTLDSIVVERPEVRPYHPQNLCADAGFSGMPAHEQIVERDYHPHVRPRGDGEGPVDSYLAARDADRDAAEGAQAEAEHVEQSDHPAAQKQGRIHLHQRLRHGVEREFEKARGEQEHEGERIA